MVVAVAKVAVNWFPIYWTVVVDWEMGMSAWVGCSIRWGCQALWL
jgi:hypothetical protein